MRILIAGIGNIFFGDDAFGCEVAQALAQKSWPENVRVQDFGIRSYDLAYAIMDHEVNILIDAIPQKNAPGTVSLIWPEINALDSGEDEAVNAHSMNPLRVLQMVSSFGGAAREVYIVGCEPAVLESNGQLGLSETVRAAIPAALEMVEELVAKFSYSTKGAVA